MQVWLLRHAKASWSMERPDAERRLTPQGERDAERMGAWMAGHGHRPDWTVSSPAVRALETARRALPDQEPVVDGRIYEATLPDLLAVLADAPADAARVLLVGHNPGLEGFVRALDPRVPHPADGELMPPCTLALIEVDALRLGGGRVLGLHRVGDLP